MVYTELKKRGLIRDRKEFNELIWLRQIKINDKVIDTQKGIKQKNIRNIKIGHLEFKL